MDLSKEAWQIAIFSVSVPILISVLVFTFKKIRTPNHNADSTPHNYNKQYSLLRKEKEKIELKLQKVELEESRLNDKKNKRIEELVQVKLKIKEIDKNHQDDYLDITDWLTAKPNIAKHIVDKILSSKIELSSDDREVLLLEIEHIIERLEVALSENSYYLLDNLYPCITLKNKKVYKHALKTLLKEIPPSISMKSKSDFSGYINYTLDFLSKRV